MKSYNFPLERVLEWRANKEKSAMEKFAEAHNELLNQKSILANLTTELVNARPGSLKYGNINELRQKFLYIQSLEEQIEKQKKIIQMTGERLEKVRAELVSAQKDRKIIEKLKEKDFTLYQDNIKAMEQRELDEIGVLKYNPSLEGR